MSELKIDSVLNRIISYSAFKDVFDELVKVDGNKANEIMNSILNCLKETRLQIENNKKDYPKLKYYLLKESIDLKAHSSGFLSYSETMALRENALWKFAFNITEQFFDIISDALEDYFNMKIKIMEKELKNNSDWYIGIRDSSKKLGVVLNYSKKILKKSLDNIGADDLLNDDDLINTQSIVEQLLAKHLSPEQVIKDISKIMEAASKQYKEKWESEIKSQSPNLNQLNAFASSYGKNIDLNVGFELGIAEQTLAIGITSAVVGSIGLAAGWHTLTYAMLNVFPPIALFAVVGTVLVAIFTKDKALENRKKQIREAVNQYHKYFLLQIEVEKLAELDNKSIREAMNEQNKKVIKNTIKMWSKAISGNLSVDHYRKIILASEKHLNLIDDAILELDKS